MKVALSNICMLILAVESASAFSAPSPVAAPWQNFLATLTGSKTKDADLQMRNELKQKLLAECSQSFGVNNKEVRQRIEDIIGDLSPLSPTRESALSPLLKKKWVLEWTSEKEINFFLEKAISEGITQTLSGDILENNIPFVKGGSFGVKGRITPAGDEDNLRTNFKFLNAKLDLGWAAFNFPPIGEGWFDTVYLDEELRIDTNSRDDILICKAGE